MNEKKSPFTHENPKPTAVPTPENRRARAAYHWENMCLAMRERNMFAPAANAQLAAISKEHESVMKAIESLTTTELVEMNIDAMKETARALIAGLHGAEVSTFDLLFNLLMGYTMARLVLDEGGAGGRIKCTNPHCNHGPQDTDHNVGGKVPEA